MVDFRKKTLKKHVQKVIDPNELYDTLDLASDIGPIRPVQESILKMWFEKHRHDKDVILKLHTGQGKTLIGLLLLQSRLNQETGPAVYLCPDNYLVQQTCDQAERFGITYCTAAKTDLPDEFIEGKSILITTVSKLFNGESKFKLGPKSLPVSTVLMDDAHACIGYIKNSYTITLKNTSPVYDEILTLFGPELEKQAVGTYADIKNKDFDSFLAVPYWDWQDKHVDVAQILSKSRALKEIKFAWPIIKDIIRDCRCIISGESLEITPYAPPLEFFGSYFNASHRVFMSATISDDSFFIKGLSVSAKTVQNPLIIENEKWSGEKMVLIPSLIDESLTRTEIVNLFAQKGQKANFGIVALSPRSEYCEDWKKYGSVIAKKENIISEIERLKNKDYSSTLVIVNRYDGIDLPDNACRILVFDSKPFTEFLDDRYTEECRSNSEVTSIKVAQIIEQGLGRGVRGEKDYCAIIVTGTELVKLIRSKETRKFFSQQTRTQVEIGMKIGEYAQEDIKEGVTAKQALINLINQLLKRDDGWKDFYKESMDEMEEQVSEKKILNIFEAEQKAEVKYRQGYYSEAASIIQSLIDTNIKSEDEKGWYLQEMARYIYPASKSESNKYQISAHKKNEYLFKPREGMVISKISAITLKRITNIIDWLKSHDNFEGLKLNIEGIVSQLRFGVDSDKFEKALDDLAKALGFVSQRPDKLWNEGPDNLWKVKDDQYLLIECKNKVLSTRKEIVKDESGQMNNACAWFSTNYGDAKVKRIMIIPTKKISRAAGFNLEVDIMREGNLKKLNSNVLKFFDEFKEIDLKDIPEKKVQELLMLHNLDVEDFLNSYTEVPSY
ncbi:DEAD/DEAH box helicase family protein [Paenibacillus sp. ACRRX]|uniref:DEAD/DEAH box helicase family protein n=1 Tax=Paenibacillus sp. ACRRX TaxID=2918206 RepID=UPI001EF71B56|nr:DEAD/DEAH box helicase family protein [Paenibacillus sp. ACRRX]MCG7406602.1 DEAD/DEAH box helicase family protein [Paenibacillus sp. ACRRX]